MKCYSGYYPSGNSCKKVPANAYASGSGWKCNNGYKKSGNSFEFYIHKALPYGGEDIDMNVKIKI